MNEAELLFTEILNCDRASLYLSRSFTLSQDKINFVAATLKRRISGEPIQYILGKTEFMGFEFKVTPDVFIPRPETEILVETILEIVQKLKSRNVGKLKILDIGTGSGCIAIALVKLLSNVTITAVDISHKAIGIARYNALLNKVTDKIKFMQGDLFTDYPRLPDRQGLPVADYDIIVSNPPYIPAEEIKTLEPEIRYEPRIALDGGRDGLDFYRRLIPESINFLKGGGFLIMEMGFNQKGFIKNIFKKYKIYKIIDIVKDYNNIDRIVVAQKRKWIN